MGLIFKEESALRSDPKTARKRAAMLAAPFALLGVFALALFVHDGLFAGGLDRQKSFTLFGAMAASVGFVALIFGISAKRETLQSKSAKIGPDLKPWLRRPDWANGRIRSTSRKPLLLLWILVFFWCFGSAAISLAVLPWQWRQGDRAVVAMLVLFVIGLALIIFAARTTRAWRRFGRATFEMASVPAATGGALCGQIKVPGVLRIEHGWRITLSCVRRKTSGPANNLRADEQVLWRDEQWLQADLPQREAWRTSIPVFFRLPEDKPDSSAGIGNGTQWQLEAWARLPGPDFQATFEVPVFKLREQPEIPQNITAPYVRSLDEVRKEIQSRIEILELTESKEFIFPSGRTPGFAGGATLLCLIWGGVVGLLIVYRAPGLLPMIFGAMDLLMLYFVLDLWFRRSRIVVSAGTITIETAWPGYQRTNRIKGADVAEFAAEAGAQVGHAVYYDLKLRTRDGKEWILAKNLNHKPEAEWLGRQLTVAAATHSAKNVNT